MSGEKVVEEENEKILNINLKKWLLDQISDLSLAKITKALLIFSAFYLGFILYTTAPFVVIEPTERAILLQFGVYSGVLGPGLHVLLPWSKIYKIPVNERTLEVQDMSALTLEGLPVSVTVTVVYQVKDPEKLYLNVGLNYESWLVEKIKGVVREVLSKYTADSLYMRVSGIRESILGLLRDRSAGYFEIKDVVIKGISIPKEIATSIVKKVRTLQDWERMRYEIELAKLEFIKKTLDSNAIAVAIQVIGKELSKYPEYIQYVWAQKLPESNARLFIITRDVNGLSLIPLVR